MHIKIRTINIVTQKKLVKVGWKKKFMNFLINQYNYLAKLTYIFRFLK